MEKVKRSTRVPVAPNQQTAANGEQWQYDSVSSKPLGRLLVDGHFSQEATTCSKKKSIKSKPILSCTKIAKIGMINSRTIRPLSKRMAIAHIFEKSGIEILVIQEDKIIHDECVGITSLTKDTYMITGSAWKNEAQATVGGVGFILPKKVYQSTMEITCISSGVLKVSFNGNPRFTMLSVYSPTKGADTEAVETLHDDIQCTVAQTPTHDILFVVGDFNAHLSKTDHKDIGWYYRQRMNRNGELLCDTMQEGNLEATNIHF